MNCESLLPSSLFRLAGVNPNIGTDTFTNVSYFAGSQFADTFSGSDNLTAFTSEDFEGRSGNDFIDGKLGLGRAVYNNDPVATGISIEHARAAGLDGIRNDRSATGKSHC